MKPKLYLLFSGLLQIIFLAKAQIAHHSIKYSEAIALKQIHELPEVKAFYKEFKKEKVDIETRDPDSTFKYYFIQVGLDRMDRFVAYYNFFINPKTDKILYWDQMNFSNKSFITLQQWRKWRHDPRFQKSHLFKNGKIIVLANNQHTVKTRSRHKY